MTHRKPRVLFVNRSYWPDAEATGQLLTDLCESLSDKFDVSVLCGQPNSNPGNATYSTEGKELRNGVTIHRLKHTQFNKRIYCGRLVNLISFTLSARKWLRRCKPYDVIVSETDPFLLPIVTAPQAAAMNASYVAYLQDIYPDIAIRLGQAKDGWITGKLRTSLRNAYLQATQIVVLSPGMKDVLKQWGIDAAKIQIIPNWVNCDLIRPCKASNSYRTANHWDDRFVVMYSGNMGLSQRLDALVRAVDHPSFPSKAILAMVGGGADEPRLRLLAQQSKRVDDIVFLSYQPRESLSESLSAADLHIISVDPRIGGTMMPSKLYGVLASGTPILAIAPESSDVAHDVKSLNVGAVVPQHDPAEIARAIAKMAQITRADYSEMQSRARQAAESLYDKSICVEKFARLLETIINNTMKFDSSTMRNEQSSFLIDSL